MSRAVVSLRVPSALIHRCRMQSTAAAAAASPGSTDHHIGSQLSSDNASAADRRNWMQQCKRFNRNSNLRLPENYAEQIKGERPMAYESRALAQVHKLSYDSDVLIEVRDVRLPASTHHPSFTRLAAHRHHLICYTHCDMIDSPTRDNVEDWTRASWPESDAFFVDSRDNRKAEVFASLYGWIANAMDNAGGPNCALTTGVANTGKSSVLYSLLKYAKREKLISKILSNPISPKGKRARKNAKRSKLPEVQDVPGKTRELTEWEVRNKPKLYFLDVPGITQAGAFFHERPEAWYGMAAANLLHQSTEMQTDPHLQHELCQYVLDCLNRDARFHYVSKFKLDRPTEDVDDCLKLFANKYANQLDEDRLLLKRTQTFLKFFNTGNLGSVVLDDWGGKYEQFVFRDEHFASDKMEKKEEHHSSTRQKRKVEQVQQRHNSVDQDDWYADYDEWRAQK